MAIITVHSAFALCITFINLIAQTGGTGSSAQGYRGYSEYFPGSPGAKLVITAPHGGALRPDSIPVRTPGCYRRSTRSCTWTSHCGTPSSSRCPVRTANDYYTQELAELLVDQVERISGVRPHLVVNHLHRSRMDPNRMKSEGTLGDPNAERAWMDYHGFITDAVSAVEGPGLLIDIHGQAHPEGWIEVGYLISTRDFNTGSLRARDSSIRSLAARSSTSFTRFIRGSSSIGGRLDTAGYSVVPSPEFPSPNTAHYYKGGYTIRQYGSRDRGNVDAIQLEMPRSLRSRDESPHYAENLANILVDFLNDNYQSK